MLNSKKSPNSKQMSADQAFYHIHVTLYLNGPFVAQIEKFKKNKVLYTLWPLMVNLDIYSINFLLLYIEIATKEPPEKRCDFKRFRDCTDEEWRRYKKRLSQIKRQMLSKWLRFK